MGDPIPHPNLTYHIYMKATDRNISKSLRL